MNPRLGLLLIAGLAACEHTSPFQAGPYAPTGPLGSGSPLRLTYNPGQDLTPVWLPDGSELLYARERFDRSDRDRCLARLPAGGGAITGELCDRIPAADDSTDAYQWPAPDTDGRLVYVRASSLAALGSLAPHDQQLVLGTFDGSAPVRVLRSIPYQSPSGRGTEAVAQIRWLNATTLLYVGQRVTYPRPCANCLADTIPTGLELVTMDLSAPTPTLDTLPGTSLASSVALAGSDTVYYTVDGDSRVFRLVLSTRAATVVHDFGGPIARDVQVAGTRLVAVVGGDVSFTYDSNLQPVQRDGGGVLHLVDLTSGADVILTNTTLAFRHPALAPSGTLVVAELVTGRTTDLWAVAVP
ncbi:MAG: hypothetical protein AUH42_00060 [Gemmatimonadetes bacterium 13_1_40CM_70_11]|nr:MAG: hypothetical protein AUH42_00060 [Gemmatimonadetes bacterium 13_1_40CM_70_11]